MDIHNQSELREIFHLEFLRWLGRKVKSVCYALKGGVNLRFFFNSFRYSEDMDLDAHAIAKETLLDAVMHILKSPSFQNGMRPFGIERITPPNITKSKQTETTQRFKVHLITYAGGDLFTKIEFSRRGFKGKIEIKPVLDNILRRYKLPPLLVPHYDISSTVTQKIEALAGRTVAQARDIFDLYILSSQCEHIERQRKSEFSMLNKALNRIFEIGFEEFRDTVISYLSGDEQEIYSRRDVWDEIKIKTADFIKDMQKKS